MLKLKFDSQYTDLETFVNLFFLLIANFVPYEVALPGCIVQFAREYISFQWLRCHGFRDTHYFL